MQAMNTLSIQNPPAIHGLLLAGDLACEAVIRASMEGLPIAWHPNPLPDLERMTQAAVALYQSARTGLAQTEGDLRMSLETEFGELAMVPLQDGTLMLTFARLPEGPSVPHLPATPEALDAPPAPSTEPSPATPPTVPEWSAQTAADTAAR